MVVLPDSVYPPAPWTSSSSGVFYFALKNDLLLTVALASNYMTEVDEGLLIDPSHSMIDI